MHGGYFLPLAQPKELTDFSPKSGPRDIIEKTVDAGVYDDTKLGKCKGHIHHVPDSLVRIILVVSKLPETLCNTLPGKKDEESYGNCKEGDCHLPVLPHSVHLVPEGKIIKYRVCPTNDIVKKKNVKDSYGNPRKYDKDDAVEPEKVFIE